MTRLTNYRVILCLLIVAAFCTPAMPQGTCAYPWNPYKWGVGGSAGDASTGPGGNPVFQQLIAMRVAQYGGPVYCQYTWWIDNYFTGYGHWSGDCVAPADGCNAPPIATCPKCRGGAPGGAPSNTKGGAAAGHPINLTTGNTYIQQTDIAVPGLGSGLALDRIWNSLWPAAQIGSQVGLFGPNWRSTYEERVFTGTGTAVNYTVYAKADGSFWYFGWNGKLASPADTSAQIASGSTYWTITLANGEQRRFDNNSGNLIAIIDRNGNTTQVAYDATSRLTTMTDPAGRHLNFTYANGSSRLVTGVSSDTGLSLSYSYDTQGRLTLVTRPDSSTLSFTYNSQSLITAVTDAQGKIIEAHTYDSRGRGLTSSRAGGVESLTVSYSNP